MTLSAPKRKSGLKPRAAASAWLAFTIGAAILAVIPLAVFALYTHNTVQASLLEREAREREVSAQQAAEWLQMEIDRVAGELEIAADSPRLEANIAAGDGEGLKRPLGKLHGRIPGAIATSAYDRTGALVGRYPSLSGQLESELGQLALQGRARSSWYVSPVQRVLGSGEAALAVALPVRDGGEFGGVILVAFSLQPMVEQILSWNEVPGRSLVILDEAGSPLVGQLGQDTPAVEAEGEQLIARAAMTEPEWTVHLQDRREAVIGSDRSFVAGLDAASLALLAAMFLVAAIGAHAFSVTRRQERGLRRQAQEQTALLEAQSGLGEILLVEEDGRLAMWNRATTDLTGFSDDDLGSLAALQDLFVGDVCPSLCNDAIAGTRAEVQIARKGGASFWAEIARHPLPRDGKPASLLIARDISEQRALQQQLREQATHDALTGLPNRTLFEDRLRQAAAARKRRGGSFGVFVLDLDLFKSVNDTLGHHAGDELLVEVGRRVRRTLRDEDTVARLGGDELALLVDRADPAGAQLVAERIADALRPSFVVQEREVRMSVSIGIAIAPDDGEGPEELLRRADLAMYEAKKQRGGHRFYASELEERMLAQVRVVTELRRALEEGQFELHYQPKISARTGQVAGIEALVRWQHPTRGLLGPAEFVPHAVRARLGRGLDAWVLRHALVAARTWQRMGLSVPVSVNVGAETVEDPGFVELVRATLRTVGVDAAGLVLELTEDATLSDPRRIGELLRELTAEGVQVSIDDFGTGYSSLLSVQHLPASELKIDRAFVRNVLTTPADQKIVRAATALARSLDMTATAEGVEDEATWALLQKLGCEQGQGYFFARPLPMAELAAWLLERPSEIDQDAIRRYADRLLQLAEPTEVMTAAERTARLEDEREGVRAVLAWAISARETELALALSAGLRRYWCDVGRLDEASHWLGSALATACDAGDASEEATIGALNDLGVVTGQQGDLAAARSLLEGCVDAARALCAETLLTRALTDLGVAAAGLGDLETAERCSVEAAALLGRAGQRVPEARQWNNIAVIRYRGGDLAAARELLEKAVDVLAERAGQRYLPDVLDTLGAVAIGQHDLATAWHAYGESLRLYRDQGVAGDVAQPLVGIAVLVSPKSPEQALHLIGASQAIQERWGSQPPLLDHLLPQLMARIEAQIGHDVSANALLRGRGLTREAAIDLALSCHAEEGWRPPVSLDEPTHTAATPGFERGLLIGSATA